MYENLIVVGYKFYLFLLRRVKIYQRVNRRRTDNTMEKGQKRANKDLHLVLHRKQRSSNTNLSKNWGELGIYLRIPSLRLLV
jgi:hypothetical protein